MKIEIDKRLKLKLKGKDIDNFKSALIKISEECAKVGFSKNTLTDDELKVLNGIKSKID